MELNVLNINGQETGRKVTLDASVFGVEPNDHVIYLDVKRYLANKRQGTHKTKERAEVASVPASSSAKKVQVEHVEVVSRALY